MSNIFFHDLKVKSGLSARTELKKFLKEIFIREKKCVERIDVIFCSDKYLLKLNQQFLKHDFYTDTMSFLISSINDPIIGEVYISIERVKSNSKELSIPLQSELVRVIIHSCLHLCGYLDKPKKSQS